MERWEQLSRFRAAVSITGAIWELKGKPDLLRDVVLEGETGHQWMRIAPFPGPGRSATWEPARQTIESVDGIALAERLDPVSSFLGLTRGSPWDDFQVAYFASEANWNYFTAPFIFDRPQFVVQETEPWHEDGEVWRRLVVTYPDSVVAHCRQQLYYFDVNGLLRRLDYSVDILGGGPAVDYPSEYREFDGIMVATRRRVHVRNPDGAPVRDTVAVAIEVSDVTFE